MNPLRLLVFFFSVILVLAVSQVSLAQPPAPVLIYPPKNETVGNTVPFLLWEGEKSDSVKSYQVEIFEEDNSSGTTKLIYKSPKLINKINRVEKPDVIHKVPSDKLEIFKTYLWRVGAKKDETSAVKWSAKWRFNTNLWEICTNTKDTDCDGISNDVEKKIGTSPYKKTLFVRPKTKIKNASGRYVYCYWDKFIKLFHSSRPGFADIPPFTHAGIEIVVIGRPPELPSDETWHRYERFDNFKYDPATDPKNPNCDIMEIIFKREVNSAGEGIYYAESESGSHGHTYFIKKVVINDETTGEEKEGWTWSGDIKGVTSKSGDHHGYFTSEIFSFALNNYINEGAYQIIAEGQSPIANLTVSRETTKTCEPHSNIPICTYSSPMNFNDPDKKTVEFIEISYENDNGKIEKIGKRGTSYDKDTVLRKTIVHEMGHALFTADNADHCSNPQCIMYRHTTNWDMLEFGPVCKGKNTTFKCQHSIRERQDIRGKDIIHNNHLDH